jgi:hypothetical protein
LRDAHDAKGTRMLVLQPWLDVQLATHHFTLRVLTWDGYQSPPDGSLLEQVELFAPPPTTNAYSLIAVMPRLRTVLHLYPSVPTPPLPAHVALHGPALCPDGDTDDNERQAKTLLLMQFERQAQQRPLYLPIRDATHPGW